MDISIALIANVPFDRANFAPKKLRLMGQIVCLELTGRGGKKRGEFPGASGR
jgi:hypothetical protein